MIEKTNVSLATRVFSESTQDSKKKKKIQKNLFNINRFTCIIFIKQINKHKYTTIIARRSHQ